MPASGPVYQPTTVSYEQQSAWMRPGNYITQNLSSRMRSPRFLQWVFLVLTLLSVVVGLVMVIDGSLLMMSEEEEAKTNADTKPVVLAVGLLLMLVGAAFGFFFHRMTVRRRACPCFPNKEERLARQLDSQGANGQVLTQNPSTDLLVTAQYAPVSEIAYQPPAPGANDHEETSKLMQTHDLIKDCPEESERMLESDPRIVLRPLSHEDA